MQLASPAPSSRRRNARYAPRYLSLFALLVTVCVLLSGCPNTGPDVPGASPRCPPSQRPAVLSRTPKQFPLRAAFNSRFQNLLPGCAGTRRGLQGREA